MKREIYPNDLEQYIEDYFNDEGVNKDSGNHEAPREYKEMAEERDWKDEGEYEDAAWTPKREVERDEKREEIYDVGHKDGHQDCDEDRKEPVCEAPEKEKPEHAECEPEPVCEEPEKTPEPVCEKEPVCEDDDHEPKPVDCEPEHEEPEKDGCYDPCEDDREDACDPDWDGGDKWEAALKEAYKDGFEKGYDDGYDEGYDDGWAKDEHDHGRDEKPVDPTAEYEDREDYDGEMNADGAEALVTKILEILEDGGYLNTGGDAPTETTEAPIDEAAA